MKTTKFRLLAMIITLAAVITATSTPANEQRRSSSDSGNSNKVESTRTANKSNNSNKSAYRSNSTKSQSANHSVRSSNDAKRNNPSAAKEMKKQISRTADNFRSNNNSRTTRQVTPGNSSQKRVEINAHANNRPTNSTRESSNSRKSEVVSASEMPRRTSGYSTTTSRNSKNTNYNSNRAVETRNSAKYNHNSNDARYTPNRNYKGSNTYWSSDFRSGNRNNMHGSKNYNYSNYKHWDRNWEAYRWNHNSWRNYYGFYNPHSYRHHKYYYHHHYYGHVIRRFSYRPQIYLHNHTRYYCYDGYFFRYRRGVGYVLVDMPFGMAFQYLPNDYERVYINGYLYFRVGNLFFEYTNYGFQLVHYPERYFAYNDGYCNEGFRFDDMNY